MNVDHHLSRRRFLQTSLSLGATLGAPWLTPGARAAEGGRALIGFQMPPLATHLITDVLGAVREHYQPDLGAKAVVLPGGSGSAAIDAVLKSPRDGGTVLIGPSTLLTLLPIMIRMPADPAEGFVPVAAIGGSPLVFMVGPVVPPQVRTISDYLDWVRANPGKNTYGLPGLATAPHFIGLEIGRRADLPLRPIGYKGPVSLADDLYSGAVPAAITLFPGPSEISHHPTLRILAVVSDARVPGFADVPTLIEAGLAETTPIETIGFFLPVGTPAEKIAELEAAVRSARQTRPVLDDMAAVAMIPTPASAVNYAAELARERKTWQALITRYNFTGQD